MSEATSATSGATNESATGAEVGTPYLGAIYIGAFPAQTFQHRCLIRAIDETDAATAIGLLIADWVQAARQNGDVVFHDGESWSLDSGSVRLFNNGVKRITDETYGELYHAFSGNGEQDTLIVTDAVYAQGPKPAPFAPAQRAAYPSPNH